MEIVREFIQTYHSRIQRNLNETRFVSTMKYFWNAFNLTERANQLHSDGVKCFVHEFVYVITEYHSEYSKIQSQIHFEIKQAKMESIVNYESDDGNLKLTNKSKSKVIMVKNVVYSQVILINCSDLLSNLYEGHTQHTAWL